MTEPHGNNLITLDPEQSIWERCFLVHPLVVVGTREPDGGQDFAPKHLAMPLSWENHFGFVCTPAHATYRNAEREGWFTVSFPRPDQVVWTSLAAAPRLENDHKHAIQALPTFAATRVPGKLLQGAYLHLECELDRVIDDFGGNSLIAGRIVAAQATAECLRDPDRDDEDVLAAAPPLAYLYPGRYAAIADTHAFPFHSGFSR